MSSPPPRSGGLARDRAVVAVARIVSGAAFILGMVGVLNTGIDDLGADSAESLFTLTVHPLTAVVWLLLGIVGIAMAVAPATSRTYCLGAGAILLAWAVLALALGDEASQALTRDRGVVALNAIGGGLCLLAALAPLPAPLVRLLERDGAGAGAGPEAPGPGGGA